MAKYILHLERFFLLRSFAFNTQAPCGYIITTMIRCHQEQLLYTLETYVKASWGEKWGKTSWRLVTKYKQIQFEIQKMHNSYFKEITHQYCSKFWNMPPNWYFFNDLFKILGWYNTIEVYITEKLKQVLSTQVFLYTYNLQCSILTF